MVRGDRIGRLGGFCFRHRWVVLACWLVALVAGVAAAGQVFNRLGEGEPAYAPESVQAGRVLDQVSDRGDDVIAVVEGVDPLELDTRGAVDRASAEVRRFAGVVEVDDPVPATDGTGLALRVTLAKLDGDAEDEAVDQVSDRLRSLADEVPGATVRLGGGAILDQEISEANQADLLTAELRAFPLTALVMVFVFAGLLAAGLPLLATLATMAGAFGVLFAFSQFVPLDGNIVTVVSMLGLALSIDYGLLLVARYREELVPEYRQALADGHRRIGRARRAAALTRAWSTAGRTILFSGLTIAATLCGLLVLGVPSLQAIAAAGISVAIVAIVTGLTFTAALLSVFGQWIRPSRRALRRAAAAPAGDRAAAPAGGRVDADGGPPTRGFFARLAAFTQRRPILVTVGTAAALVIAGAPLLGATIKLPLLEGMPRSIESVAVADELSTQYGVSTSPTVTVVARTDPASLDAWASRWETDVEVSRVEPARLAGPDLSTVSLAVHGDAQGQGAQELVERLRADRPEGVESWVTGNAAVLVDILDTLRTGLPWGVMVTLVAMLVLLFWMTGSLVVPIKAILMALVSLGATFGVLVGLFQHGWLSGPLDTQPIGGLSPFVLGIVFAFALGLSMDYEVFLLSRVKEYVDAGHDTNAAVRLGLQRTGRVITAAALLMLVVFACFGAAKIGDIEQIGIGLFVAVLVDATIVRCLLVPATMTLLGRWNWWAPAFLRGLHNRYGVHERRAVAEPVDVR
jgi:RND superfamily putative drug exporter